MQPFLENVEWVMNKYKAVCAKISKPTTRSHIQNRRSAQRWKTALQLEGV